MASAIQFGEWRPDRAPHMSPDLTEAVNVLSVAGGYAPVPSHVQIAGTHLGFRAQGFFSVPAASGEPIVYTATGQRVYRIKNGAFAQAYYAGDYADAPWWFAQLAGEIVTGNRYVSPVAGRPGTDFSPVSADAPAAAVGAIVDRNFLMLGNLSNDGIDGAKPARVRWAGFRNIRTWGTSVGTQADFEDMHDEGGPVVAITGRGNGTVFQRKAITRITPNPTTVFDFTTVELGRGPISRGAVCDIGPYQFYRADDGFFAWDGIQSVPIGTDKVDRWFADNVNPARLERISSGYDPTTRCVLWAFPEQGQDDNSAIISYSMADQRWTLIRKAMQYIGASATFPATIESMPTPDASGISWDDPAYAGKRPVLAGIDGDGTYGTFTGEAMAYTLTTGDYISKAGSRSFVSGVRPIIDDLETTIAVGTKNQRDSDPIVWKAPTSPGVDGKCPQRVDARLLRYRMAGDAGNDWSRAVGLELDVQASGLR
jgi:hypothetical protein